MWWKIVLSFVIGYLLGSVSPAYFLGRLVKGIDIREYGDGNAGTVNAGNVIGIWAAFLTLLYDATKGLLSIFLSFHFLKIPESLIFIPVYSTILGHIFPFYLGFKGGQGAATSAGVFVFYTVKSALENKMEPLSLLSVLAVAILMALGTGNGEAVGLVTTIFMGYVILVEMGGGAISILLVSLSIFLFLLTLRNSIKKNLFSLEKEEDVKWWRIAVRPFALLFIPIHHYLGKKFLLLVIGIVALIFIITDSVRLFTKLFLKSIYKQKEKKTFSSMTTFLITSFIIFLLFPYRISYLSLGFMTIGDMMGKLVGLKFGSKKLLKNRTLEGSLGFMTGSFIAGYVIYKLVPLSYLYLLPGVLFATLVELFSGGMDDNLTVGLLTSSFLYSIKYFLQI